jgi:hypothetical protein
MTRSTLRLGSSRVNRATVLEIIVNKIIIWCVGMGEGLATIPNGASRPSVDGFDLTRGDDVGSVALSAWALRCRSTLEPRSILNWGAD